MVTRMSVKKKRKKFATYWWRWPSTQIGCGDGGREWCWTRMRMVEDADGGGHGWWWMQMVVDADDGGHGWWRTRMVVGNESVTQHIMCT